MTTAWWRRARSATLASATSAVPVGPTANPLFAPRPGPGPVRHRSPDLTSRARHACQVPSRQICPIAPDGRRSDPPYSAASSMTRRTRRSSRSKATDAPASRTSGLQPEGVPGPCIFSFLRCSRPVLGPHFGEEPGQVRAPGRHRDRGAASAPDTPRQRASTAPRSTGWAAAPTAPRSAPRVAIVIVVQPAPATRRGSAHPPHHDRLGGPPRPEEARRTPFHRAGSR
jgi:hypothetical protein